ncbi:MAG: malonyl-ACP O-methyltransferase BioC [Gammaproteobacteria bacterium]
MQTVINEKQSIKSCFNKAAASYDNAAHIQKMAANYLANELNNINTRPHIILDMGSGTGYSTRLLTEHYSTAAITGIDLSDNMVNQAKNIHSTASYLCADFDALAFQNNSIDLIFSSMALQWSLNLTATLAEWHRLLAANGYLLLCTLGSNSLHELRTCWKATDQSCRVNYFPTIENIKTQLAEQGFLIKSDKILIEKMVYDDFLAVLYSLKQIGANHVIDKSKSNKLTKRTFFMAEQYYQRYQIAHQLPVTYELYFVIAEAKK